MATPPPNRREFLSTLARCAGGVCLGGALGGWLPRDALAGDEPPFPRAVDYYERQDAGVIRCGVCPRHCVLAPGETGQCRSRTNVGGTHYARGYGKPAIISVDPVEKLPLNHFRPKSRTMTLAVGGCNLHCRYCQNWQHSQRQPDRLKTYDLMPKDAVDAARKKRIDTIAFSYTEPTASLEYVLDVAAEARKKRMKVVVASAGFIEPEPLAALAQHVDAFAIGLKGFDDAFYRDMTGAWLEPVLKTIETIHTQTDCWLEIVNLVVPTHNDDVSRIRAMSAWIHEHVGADVPLHFERFVPSYQLRNLPRTPVQTLEAAVAAAHDAGLRYPYTSNLAPHDTSNTYCAACGTRVIQRLGFKILEDTLKRGKCPNCKQTLPGVWN
jgi:pyruvate formate lyase activating enzyme